MSNNKKRKITKEQTEVIAEQMANFFFDFWQTNNLTSNKKVNSDATLKSGFSSGDFPDNKVVS